MGWATLAIEKLKAGESVKIRPRGNSMQGKIESGSLVEIIPVGDNEIKVNDIVLCKVHGNEYLHIVKAKKNNEYLIGNNRGGINGWTSRKNIYGLFVRIIV